MKEIFHEYGMSLLTAGVVMLLILLVFTRVTVGEESGLLPILGAKSEIDGKNYKNYADSSTSQKVSSSHLPVIEYAGGVLKKGKKIDLTTLFTAEDWKGNKLIPQIRELRDENDSLLSLDGRLGEFVFPKTGIYRVWLKARDKEGGTTRALFYIPVNSGGGIEE